MNYSKLIHEYLDLGLDFSNEQVLFSQLASDMETRNDFNLQLRMHKATSEHNKFIAPPMEVTSQLFGNLGFSIPTSIIATSEASRPLATAFMSSIAIGFLNFIRDNYVTMLSFVAGSAIATMLMFWFGIESPNNKNNYAKNNTNLPLNSFNQNLVSIPVSSNKEIENNSKNTKDYSKTSPNQNNFSRVSYKNKNDNFTLTNTPITNFTNTQSLTQELIKEVKNSIEKGELVILEKSNNSSNSNNNQTQMIIFSNSKSEPINLIRDAFDNKNMRFTRFVLPEPPENSGYIRSLNTNEAKPGSIFGNIVLGYNHYFIDNIALKVEMGLEQYNLLKFQVESGKNEISNESIGWFGVGASFNARELSIIPYEVFPYADFIIGGTTQGFLGRGQFGIEIVPESKIGLMIGYEFIKMYYKDNQQYKSLNSSGLSIGMKLSF